MPSALDYTKPTDASLSSSASTSAEMPKSTPDDLFSGAPKKAPSPSGGLTVPGQLETPKATPVGAIPFGPPAPASPVYNDSRGASQRLQVRQKAAELAKTVSTPTVTPSQFQNDALTPQADKQGQQNALLASTVATPGVIQSNKLGETAIRGAGEAENAKALADMAASQAKSTASSDAIRAQNDAATAAGVSMKYVTQKDPKTGTEISFWVNSTTGEPQIPPSNEPITEGKYGQQQGDMILSGQYFGLTTGQAEAIEKAGGDVKKKYDEAIGAQERQSAQDQATALIRGGQSGGFLNSQISGTAATKAGSNWVGAGGTLKRLQEDYDRAITSLKEEAIKAENQARDYALTAARTGKAADLDAANAAKNYIAEVQGRQQAAAEDFQKKQKATLELQKLDVSEGGAIYSMVQAGTQPTQEDLDLIDEMRGYTPGTAQSLYSATQKIENRKAAKEATDAYKDGLSIQKDLAALEDIPMNRQMKQLEMQDKLQKAKMASTDEMNSIFTAMKNAPNGLPIQIGDASYFGISGGAVFEKDKNGDGRLAFKDASGQIQIQSVGAFGDPEDVETVYVNGMQVLRNKKTKQLMPVNVGNYAQPGADIWAKKYPDGSTNPYRPNDPMGRECAGYCNDLYAGGKVWSDKLSEKLVQAKPYEVPKEDIQVEDTIVMSTNAQWGHVAIVSQVFQDENGKTMVQLNESNFIPPGGGKISNSRTMSIDDPRLKAVARIPLNPDRAPSSPVSSLNGVSGNAESFGVENPFITPNTQMTESQQQEAEQKFRLAKTAAQELLAGSDKSDIPLEIRMEAMALARQKGWGGGAAKDVPVPDFNEFARGYEAAAAKDPSIKYLNQEQLKKIYNEKVGSVPYLLDAAENLSFKVSDKKAPQVISAVRKAVDAGDYEGARDKLRKLALDTADTTTSQQVRGRDSSIKALETIGQELKDYKAKGGDTGLLTGNLEQLAQKVGTVSDPERRRIATKIQAAVADYRKSISGAAFTEAEKKEYDQMFPSVINQDSLNEANISALLEIFNQGNESFYRQQLGNQNYAAIFGQQ